MQRSIKFGLSLLVSGVFCAVVAGLPQPAAATNGYFSIGYGMKATGMGGASTATSQDTLGGATNPASMAFVGNRLDIGVTAFNPLRSSTRSGLGPGLDGTSVSGSNLFGIPEFGYNHMANPKLALGISMYGNGGLNTNYASGNYNCGGGPANMLCGRGTLGVNLVQLIIAPTVAIKMSATQAIGISPLFGYQEFTAQGLQAFAGIPGLSIDPAHLTNTGPQSSTGVGVRVGYMNQVSKAFSFGAAYATKIRMSNFTRYAGLFAGGGNFDIPENYNFGIAFLADPKLLLAVDYQRINYSGVPSVSDPITAPAQLGSANGPGFGWRSINVFKFGLSYKSDPNLTLRAGYNRGDNPVQARDVTINILAPGVTTDHVSLGFTRSFAHGGELSGAFVRAFNNSVSGKSLLPAFMGGAPAGNETIQLQGNSFGLAYGHSF